MVTVMTTLLVLLGGCVSAGDGGDQLGEEEEEEVEVDSER